VRTIAGYRVRGGEAWHLVLQITGAERSAVVSTPLIRGPFVVVAVQFGVSTSTSPSAAVTVVRSPLEAMTSNSYIPVRGVPIIERAPVINVAGGPAIGDPRMYPGRTYHWPWYVHEGEEAALALWVWDSGPIVFTDLEAMLSIWHLAREGSHEARVPVGAGAGAGQYQQVVGRLAGRPVG
jgi:hypothetical protein